MIDYSKLNKEELKILLKNLKLYRLLKKQLGNRGKIEFQKVIYKKSFYKVEYFEGVGKDFLQRDIFNIYTKIFGVDQRELEGNLVLLKNNSLKGGIRIFKDDNLLDLSFLKYEKKLLK